MKTILLDVYNEKIETIDIKNNLDDFYKKLDCSCIDIVNRKIGRTKWFNIMCDDEGLLRKPQKISAINNMGKPMLVGNLMFFLNDGNGNLLGLKQEDINYIMTYIQMMYTKHFPEGYLMLTQCEYQ